MNQKQKQKQTLNIEVVHTKPAQTEKVCAFNKELACENCRLFIEIPGFPGQRQCALILAAIR